MPRYGSRGSAPALRTAPVLAVLVCHDGATWLPAALAALRTSAPRPRHVLAVDTGSLDETPALLTEAVEDGLLDGVLTLDRRTGFAAAVHQAVATAVERWGDPGTWIWVLHDDCAPEPGCLATLLSAADASPSAGVLGPLALDWDDPRLVVEAGLSADASGHRQTGIGPSELDWSRLDRRHGYEQSTEVLAMPSAGMLVRRELWERLGGFDPEIPLLREDVDFGWRVNRAGSVVLCVPAARMRHVRAVSARLRGADART
ncbi:MAG: glycosyltransferase family 2 protein, partial [Actinophytocola sp.]|uniref:glycosyltransferase family 2 protein n=1 Tax=Actinophytocola sp. TaxID=1872138 RepID=UPI003D6B434B